MARTLIDATLRRMEAVYRADPFHALRKNLESVRPEEWDVQPAGWTVAEFGDQPELSICDLAMHVAGAKVMYANRAFGDASLEWHAISVPAREMAAVLEWLDDGQRALTDGLAALGDDTELQEQRPAPWGVPMTRERLLGIVINHDLYHSGEINRQRALIRGTEGWDRER
jgi:hypothetical protein